MAMEKEEAEQKIRADPWAHQSAEGTTPQRNSIAFRAPQQNFSINDFELGKVYGVGSYSKVVKARKKDTGTSYTLKIMNKNFIIKENKTLSAKTERVVLDQLDHPGIIRLCFTFQDSHSIYMALEPCEGGELFDRIAKRGRLAEDETRFYTAEIVDSLEYLHGLGLIHRDIKPENLLLTADGHIKVADFGCIKPTNYCRIAVPLNASNDNGCFVGTIAYIPPEAINSAPPSLGNDLWALGCTLYQMLSGTSPFKDATEWNTVQRIITKDLTFPEWFSDEASDLIDKLLDMDPTKRLGAGIDGYLALKIHPFFKGIDWKNLRKSPLRFNLDINRGPSDDNAQDVTCNLLQSEDCLMYPQSTPDRSSGSTTSSDAQLHAPVMSTIDSFDSKWRDFLEPGESIMMISKLKKRHTLTSKKVQLILTDKPRLVSIDTSKSVWTAKTVWSDDPKDLNLQVQNASHFKILTPSKVLTFEDPKQRAWQWKKAVEGLHKDKFLLGRGPV